MDAIRVLVAEDDTAIRKCLLAVLKRDADVEVIDVCVTAAQTAAALQRTSPDLLFLDVAMPGMSGFDILACNDEDTHPEVIFIACSDRDAARAFEVGALDYLVCPLTEQRIQRSLDRARTLIRLLDESGGARSPDSNTMTHLFSNQEANEATPAQQNGRYLNRVVVKSDE
ncbi:MAG: response regulator, partial [Gemmatimonadota bacterium]